MTAEVGSDVSSLEELAAEAHAFFGARVPRRERTVGGWGDGNDDIVGVGLAHGADEDAEIAAARSWQAELFDAGLAWVDGPVEFGGRGLSAEHAVLVRRISAEYEVPSTSSFLVSHEIVGPAILVHGTPDQKARWLRRIWRGEVMCCQLFSEPEAGSDLASLRTTATVDGDEWRVTGQKLWSSGAHYSQLGELLARTGPADGRNRTITAFLVEMDQPGIDIRPLRQITGSEHFNEVFLDDVVIADAMRLGPVDGGWRVAQTTLGGERSLMSDEHNPIMRDPVRRLFELAEHVGAIDDPAVLDQLAEAWAREQILRATGGRLEGGDAPPGSVVKLQMTSNMEYFAEVAGGLLGLDLAFDSGEWGTYAWSQLVLAAPAHRIAGGSDEIQRNIIAERVLGLPRELRPS